MILSAQICDRRAGGFWGAAPFLIGRNLSRMNIVVLIGIVITLVTGIPGAAPAAQEPSAEA